MSNGGPFSAPILKVIQECISLTAFGIFSVRAVSLLRPRATGAPTPAFLNLSASHSCDHACDSALELQLRS